MNEDALSQLYLKDTAFQDLMQCRIFNVLLVASPYDAFMMEEDGRVEEQLYFEYVALNLSSPPRVTRVSDFEAALSELHNKHYDLVVAMPGVDISTFFEGARGLKRSFPDTPIVILTPFSREVSRRLEHEDMSGIDYVFSWLGNMDLLLAIIKLLEDKMNAEHDINDVGVQMILLVEDSIRFYSSVLPHIYKFLLKQSMAFATEALNEHEQMLRMRGRPKVMLARDYEEAVALYEKYGGHTLGIISDVSFRRNGAKDSLAGIHLSQWLRKCDPHLPIIIESSESSNAAEAEALGAVFIDKNSKKLPVDLGDAIMGNFGFGDFVIKDPDTGKEIMRLSTLKDLQKHVFEIPAKSLYYHASSNDISRWLYSRAMFPIAEVMKMHRFCSLDEADAVRQLIFDLIVKYRKMKNRGVVAVFQKDRFDHYSNFARIGQGSLGGKGRGLAFVDSIIKKNPVCDHFGGVSISIPRSVVLCTDIFDEFMAENNLYQLALSNASDREILEAFLEAKLPVRLIEDFFALFEVVDRPLAVRSSSLLEDSHYQPFAGIYATYMIPHVKDPYRMLKLLSDAIKGVYASVFYADSKAYMNATRNVIDQEKMAIIIQEVVGENHGYLYFPSFAGVGRSLNYYPTGDEQAEDGVAQVAVGLGKYIVDGGASLRFSPRHPDKVLQTSTIELALRDTQRHFYALGNDISSGFDVDDSFNLVRRNISDYAGDSALDLMVSTYDADNDMLIDNNLGPGRRVVTFANILRDKAFPLAPAVDFMLTQGQQAMGRPVEIEFAGVINDSNARRAGADKGHIYWLQIRPIIDRKDMVEDTVLNASDDRVILRSNTALGHGAIDAIDTVVYVRPSDFDSAATRDIAAEIAHINAEFVRQDRNYILIGPGRWGTSDPALGIPVKWPEISAARLIAEASLGDYRIEPSQGTHFFQNLTSFGVGYFTVNPYSGDGIYDTDYLDAQPAEYESAHVRVVRLSAPMPIGIDGRRGIGVVLKPTDTQDNTTIPNI
jgi:CheY-like chemotaxis protein